MDVAIIDIMVTFKMNAPKIYKYGNSVLPLSYSMVCQDVIYCLYSTNNRVVSRGLYDHVLLMITVSSAVRGFTIFKCLFINNDFI